MTCAKGVFKVRKQDLNDFADGRIAAVTSTAYGVEHGLSSTVGTIGHQPGAYAARDGRVWFPMAVGVNVVAPEQPSPRSLPPPVHIEDDFDQFENLPDESARRREPGVATWCFATPV